jgi:hypothetical protein
MNEDPGLTDAEYVYWADIHELAGLTAGTTDFESTRTQEGQTVTDQVKKIAQGVWHVVQLVVDSADFRH